MIINYLKKIKYAVTDLNIKVVTPFNFRQKINFLVLFIKGKALDEVYIKGGDNNSDKTFYIIRRPSNNVGLLSLYITILGRIKYAIDKGYVPVIDMQYYKNNYLQPSQLGKINSYEYYFNQPFGYSLKDAYNSKKLILSDTGLNFDFPRDSMEFFNNKNENLNKWRELADKYLRINNDILEDAETRYNNFCQENNAKNVLGVFLRGTDYTRLKPKYHPIQPEIDEAIEDVKKYILQNECDLIYLCTEDKEILNRFINEFGSKIVFNSKNIVDYKGEGYIVESIKHECQYNRGYEYLISILMLSKTNYIVASRASGSVGAMVLSKGFEGQIIYDLGRY